MTQLEPLPLRITASEEDRILDYIRQQILLMDAVKFSMIDRWGYWIPNSYRRAVKKDLMDRFSSLTYSEAMKNIILSRIAAFITSTGRAAEGQNHEGR